MLCLFDLRLSHFQVSFFEAILLQKFFFLFQCFLLHLELNDIFRYQPGIDSLSFDLWRWCVAFNLLALGLAVFVLGEELLVLFHH